MKLICLQSSVRNHDLYGLDVDTRDLIVLTDQWVECSRVVKTALDMIYTCKLNEIQQENYTTYLYVMDFAQKWDIGAIPTLIGYGFREAITRQECCAFELLLIALKLGDNKLASLAFGSESRERWPAGDLDWNAEGPELGDEGDLCMLPPNYQNKGIYSLPDLEFPPHGGDIFNLGASPMHGSLSFPPRCSGLYFALNTSPLSATRS